MKKALTVLLSALALTTASVASAEDFSLHMSGGVAQTVGSPQMENFRPGVSGDAKLLFPVFTPNLAIGPSVSVLSLESQADHTQNATVWGFGATARLQGNRSGDIGSPWVDITGSVDKQASLFRPGLAAAVGVDLFTDQSHTFSMGPVVGYQHVFENTYQKATGLLPHQDANVLVVGLSLSFDGAPKPIVHTEVKTETKTETKTVQVPVQVVKVVPVPMPSDNDGVAVQMNKSIQFGKDSASLDNDSKSFLDDLASKFNKATGYELVVEGYASSEGGAAHNLALSQSRANTVANYLVVNGKVDRNRLTATAKGAVGDANNADNRRADLVVVRVVRVQK